ncbi:hypothetical protein BYT27DRAFT_7219727 [Phlegmacium glaucopus]|nr:hypothetical protein BYT27DRAFT_7219727 [Phlegmacium glaucopus]
MSFWGKNWCDRLLFCSSSPGIDQVYSDERARRQPPVVDDFPSPNNVAQVGAVFGWQVLEDGAASEKADVIGVFDGRRALDNVVTSAPYISRICFVGISSCVLWDVPAIGAECVVGDNSTHCCVVARTELGWRMGKDVFVFKLPKKLNLVMGDMAAHQQDDLMCDPNSPILDFYPLEFELDRNRKKQDWEAIVKIPFIDQDRLWQRSNIEILGERALNSGSTHMKRHHGVNVHGTESRNKSMIIHIKSMIIHIKNMYEGRKTQDEIWLEGLVVAVSDSMFKYEKFVVTPGGPAEVISTPYGSNHWESKGERLGGRCSEQCGVITGDLEVLLHVRPLKVLKPLESGAFFFPSEKAEIDKFNSRKEGRNWDYSEKAIELLRGYKSKLPTVFRCLDGNGDASFLDRSRRRFVKSIPRQAVLKPSHVAYRLQNQQFAPGDRGKIRNLYD